MSKHDRKLHKVLRRMETRQRRELVALKRDLISAVLAATDPERKWRELPLHLADVEAVDA